MKTVYEIHCRDTHPLWGHLGYKYFYSTYLTQSEAERAANKANRGEHPDNIFETDEPLSTWKPISEQNFYVVKVQDNV